MSILAWRSWPEEQTRLSLVAWAPVFTARPLALKSRKPQPHRRATFSPVSHRGSPTPHGAAASPSPGRQPGCNQHGLSNVRGSYLSGVKGWTVAPKTVSLSQPLEPGTVVLFGKSIFADCRGFRVALPKSYGRCPHEKKAEGPDTCEMRQRLD